MGVPEKWSNQAMLSDQADKNHRVQLLTTTGRRIMGAMFLLALVPLVVMAGQGYHCARQALVDSTEAHMRSVAESWRVVIESWLGERLSDLAVMSRSEHCASLVRLGDGEGRGSPVCPYLETFKEEGDTYAGIALFDSMWDRAGGTQASATVSTPPAEVREKLLAGGRPVLFTLGSDSPDRLAVSLATALFGGGNEVVGYVVARLDLEEALRPLLAADTGLGRTGKVYIVDQDGKLIAHPPGFPGGEDGTVWSGGPLLAESRSRESGSGIYRDWRGVEVVGGYAWLPQPRWALVAEVNRSEALSWLAVLRWRAAIVGVLTVIAVVCFSTIAARRLSSPLRQLAAVARSIGKGNHGERIEITGSEEAEDVSQAFNQMLSDLAASHRRLAKAASLAAVGELSSSIVHEMRNPLSSVKMNLQALAKAATGDAVHQELAEIALDQARRVEQMLNDLLNYGKPLQLEFQACEVGQLIAAAFSVVGAEAAAKGVSMDVRESETGLLARVDQERFVQMLTNLLFNACQAAKPSGRVQVRAGRQGERLVIEVEDDGPGIPPANLELVFRPFFTTRKDGTGLGLANAKKIVELHGGEISAHNSPAGGAVFRVSLPLGEASA